MPKSTARRANNRRRRAEHRAQYLHQAARILHADGDKAATVAAEHAPAPPTGRDDKVADELAAAATTRPDADDHKKIGEPVTYPRNKQTRLPAL